MTDPTDREGPPPHALHRSYSRWWGWLTTTLLVVELVAIQRRAPGDTLSEHVWRVVHGWAGVPILALLTWLSLWHLPWGAGRRLSWADLAAASVGALVWLAARRWAL